MPRLSADTWQTIRAERETGESFPELAKKHGVSHQAIQKRAVKEKWGDGADITAVIRRKVAEKVAGVVAGYNPQKLADAIDSKAEEGAGIIRTHRAEWETHRAKFAVPDDFEVGKLAKISSEMLTIRQKGERAAWGLDDASVAPTIVIERSYGK